jgi:hypothetical protein
VDKALELDEEEEDRRTDHPAGYEMEREVPNDQPPDDLKENLRPGP